MFRLHHVFQFHLSVLNTQLLARAVGFDDANLLGLVQSAAVAFPVWVSKVRMTLVLFWVVVVVHIVTHRIYSLQRIIVVGVKVALVAGLRILSGLWS